MPVLQSYHIVVLSVFRIFLYIICNVLHPIKPYFFVLIICYFSFGFIFQLYASHYNNIADIINPNSQNFNYMN